jgi:hypothetical protein
MIEKDDWRLANQKDWLMDIELTHGRFRQTTEDFDHAHCEFCWTKFMDSEYRANRGYETPRDVVTEGFHTQDGFRWICNSCYEDFRDIFRWTVVKN